jgi:hypothetical protein
MYSLWTTSRVSGLIDITLNFVNPVNGDPVFPTFTYAAQLLRGRGKRPCRRAMNSRRRSARAPRPMTSLTGTQQFVGSRGHNAPTAEVESMAVSLHQIASDM